MSFAFGFSVDDGGEEALDSLSMPTTTDVKEHVYSEKTRQLSKEELVRFCAPDAVRATA